MTETFYVGLLKWDTLQLTNFPLKVFVLILRPLLPYAYSLSFGHDLCLLLHALEHVCILLHSFPHLSAFGTLSYIFSAFPTLILIFTHFLMLSQLFYFTLFCINFAHFVILFFAFWHTFSAFGTLMLTLLLLHTASQPFGLQVPIKDKFLRYCPCPDQSD